MSENSGGRIFNVSKGKGYESLSREMLQDENLSLEAIGLLANIQSYPSNWKLYKTELYTRFKHNKRKSIERIWNELVSNGYIVQFRKRIGKKYIYQYLVSSEKYTKNEIIDLIEEAKTDGFDFYHKDMLNVDDISSINPIDFINLKGDKIKNSDNVKQGGGKEAACNSDKHDNINDSWDVPFGQSNLNSSKGTDNKLTSKRSTTKKLTNTKELSKKDDDEINNNKANDLLDRMSQIIKSNDEFKILAQLLFEINVGLDEISIILEYFNSNPENFKIDVIEQQLIWMQQKSATGVGISDFSVYFIKGVEKRMQSNRVSVDESIEKEFYSRLGIEEDLPQVPMFNWLKGE
ncbi:hypothetical protein ACWN8V_07160 [Vagococcus elongatus]|uniref:DnaD domain-containing protein n=1 Tax=Vagococcus elongatus TaxID=180344 RepID=A0A430AW72_9ENTE|nr:hypothetical protein [Vagococcus elongatus]RSU12311.1 hypothetical protein CBF29_06835 [Vagococcus elongatus]